MLNNLGLKPSLIVAFYTAKEVIKSKVLINTLLIGVGLFVSTYIAYSFTYGEPARVALDFGLGALSLSTVGIALFIGVGILADEINNRTVYLVISRPVARWSFLLGKILGLSFVLFLNVIILSIITLLLYFLIGGNYQSLISWAIVFIGVEAMIVLLVVSFFSLITSKVLSVILTIVVYVVGHSIDGAKLTTFVELRPLVSNFLDLYQFILPGFYKLNLKDFVLYKQELELSYLISHLSYGILYAAALVLLSIFIFNKKNLD